MEENKNISKQEQQINEEELTQVSGGAGNNRRYTCANPNCPMHLQYLQFKPDLGRCEECGQPVRPVV